MKVPKAQKLPSGTWYIHMKLDGENIPVTATTERECIQKATLIKAEYKAGRRATYSKNTITVDAAIKKYCDDRSKSVKPLSPSTESRYLAYNKLYLTSIAQTPLRDVDWQTVINQLSRQYAPKTVKNVWGLVTAVLSYNELPKPSVVLPDLVEKEIEIIDPEDLPKFIAYIINKPVAMSAMLALHSLRRSEIAALKWEDIDMVNKTIHVNGAVVYNKDGKLIDKQSNKTKKSNRIVKIMIPELYDLLLAETDKTGKVLKAHISTSYLQIQNACKAIGIKPVGVHGLRHSFASLAYHLKMTELETMEIGGWSDPATMRKIYTHLAAKDRLKAENKMAAFYSAIKPQEQRSTTE